jgi:hypothetical protein
VELSQNSENKRQRKNSESRKEDIAKLDGGVDTSSVSSQSTNSGITSSQRTNDNNSTPIMLTSSVSSVLSVFSWNESMYTNEKETFMRIYAFNYEDRHYYIDYKDNDCTESKYSGLK